MNGEGGAEWKQLGPLSCFFQRGRCMFVVAGLAKALAASLDSAGPYWVGIWAPVDKQMLRYAVLSAFARAHLFRLLLEAAVLGAAKHTVSW